MDNCRYWEAGWKLVKAFSPPTPIVHPGCAAILERRYDLVRPKPAVKATLHVRTIRSCIPRPFCARHLLIPLCTRAIARNSIEGLERVQGCNGSGVSKLAFCQGRHDAELRMRIKPLAPASVAACAPHLKGQNPCKFHQFFWASRGLISIGVPEQNCSKANSHFWLRASRRADFRNRNT